MNWLLAHAGVRDLLCAFVLAVTAVVGLMLEPSSKNLWTILPLSFTAALTLSGILLLFHSRATHALAMVIHVPLLLAWSAGRRSVPAAPLSGLGTTAVGQAFTTVPDEIRHGHGGVST